MNLVVIVGPPAVGKMTVGMELALSPTDVARRAIERFRLPQVAG